MDKKTTTLLAVGVLAGVAYLLWKQQQKPKSFANLMAPVGLDDAESSVIIVEECQQNRTTGNMRRVDVGGLFGNRRAWQCCGNRQKYALRRPDNDCSAPAQS